jgi:glucose uptake protein GlcU
VERTRNGISKGFEAKFRSNLMSNQCFFSTVYAGIAAGVCWNIANVSSMFAIDYIGYGVAYPIMQCGLFVAGVWGIFLFDEIKPGKPRTIYWLSGFILIAGASLLTLGK